LGCYIKEKPNKYSPKSKEKMCRYASESYKLKTTNNTDREILVIIHVINSFRLYLDFKEFTVKIDCEAICKYYNQINNKKNSTRRWVLFEDIVTGNDYNNKKSSTRRLVLFEDIVIENDYKVIFEYIKGKYNKLSDLFSRSSMLQV
jgi:hypothetical protein